MKTTWNIIKQGTGKIHVTEQMHSLLINNEKIKYPEKVADVFSSFFLSVAETLNLRQVGNKDPISFLKDSLPLNSMVLKLPPTLKLR
jgi:hypothetical protein